MIFFEVIVLLGFIIRRRSVCVLLFFYLCFEFLFSLVFVKKILKFVMMRKVILGVVI